MGHSNDRNPNPEMIRARRGVNGGWALSPVQDNRGVMDPEAYFSDADEAVIAFAEMIGAPIYERIRPDAIVTLAGGTLEVPSHVLPGHAFPKN